MRQLTTTWITALTILAVPAAADVGDELHKLIPDDGETADAFGFSVAINDAPGVHTAIIGGPFDDDNGEASGSAYLFDTATGEQIVKLLPEDGATIHFFGTAVGISGSTAIAGSYGDDDNGNLSGSAYLFDAATGEEIAKLLPIDGAASDWFGYRVAISGSIAIVSARNDDDNGTQSGSAYLFDTTTGQQIDKLLPEDGETFDQFGISVAISGTTAIVGAFWDDDNGSASGSAYLFDTANGEQLWKLLPEDGEASDNFGWSVAISGDIAIVGANKSDDFGSDSGSAYLFDVNTGQQIAKLLPDDGAALDEFGMSVAVSADIAVVGAWKDDVNGNASGAAYLFDTANGQQIIKLVPDDNDPGDGVGHSVAINATHALVSAHGDSDGDLNAGAAYLFEAGAGEPVTPDLNGDGNVDGADLGVLLGNWGQPGSTDLNGDGTTDGADLGILLGAWGS